MINKTILSEAIAGRMPEEKKYKYVVYATGSIIDDKGIHYTTEEYKKINPELSEISTKALSKSMRLIK